MRLFVHQHRHKAVLQTVGAEDVGELGADHRGDAEVLQRPRGMLARRPQPILRPATRMLAPVRFGLVEREVGFRIAG
jgi:hypothetical protein